MNVFNLPPHLPFLNSLALGIRSQAKEAGCALADFTVLLPTRRACRGLADEFLQITGGKPLLLPRIIPIGDVDQDELILIGSSDADLLPPISSTARQVILSRYISEWCQTVRREKMSVAQSLALAKTLGQWIDQSIIEELDQSRLDKLAPGDFAAHWQDVAGFLSGFCKNWDAELKGRGMIDAQSRRRQLLYLQAAHWRDHPSKRPVIAAGSTGSIPATSALLAAIAAMPAGAVILPGLDQDIDETSWQAVDICHPQFFIKKLIDRLQIERDAVRIWPFAPLAKSHGGSKLWSEVLRPAETTDHWRSADISARNISNLTLIESAHSDEEASIIALIMRETLETPDKTACLVTPDRDLARRVCAQLRRWDIAVDDSGGQRLSDTLAGQFLILGARLVAGNFRPTLLLAFLTHPLCGLGFDTAELRAMARRLEWHLRRDEDFIFAPSLGIAQYADFAAAAGCKDLHQRLVDVFQPLSARSSVRIDAFIAAMESSAATPSSTGDETLWRGAAGKAAAEFFDNLLSSDFSSLGCAADAFAEILNTEFSEISLFQPLYAAHRLKIWGILESRLQKCDRIILAGLNESVWPPSAESDPWMSRPMRAEFGLPSRERRIGQTAHDLAQLASQDSEIFLLRSVRSGGELQLASRFWVRLEAVLTAKNIIALAIERGRKYVDWAKIMDAPSQLIAIPRPAPAPPISSRPVKFSVSSVELWMRDPYAFYARYILNLKKLQELERKFQNVPRGTFLHRTLEQFLKNYPSEDILKVGEKNLRPWMHDPFVGVVWIRRLKKILHWFESYDASLRPTIKRSHLETDGRYDFAIGHRDYTLTAQADRIDEFKDGTVSIIDYKSGQIPTLTDMKNGLSPQLPLEAAILAQGGYPGIGAQALTSLQFWRLNGNGSGGEVKKFDVGLDEISEDALSGLQKLIERFSDRNQVYISEPHGAAKIKNKDYRHLSRSAEWSGEDSEESDAA